MSTRKAKNPEGPLSQSRYMSSPEYAELRGVNAVAVRDRAAILEDPRKRALIWFLQAKSLKPGGLKKIAEELVAMFPERLGTVTMHGLRAKEVPADIASKVHLELGILDEWESAQYREMTRRGVAAKFQEDALDALAGIQSETAPWPVRPRKPVPMENLIGLCRSAALLRCSLDDSRRTELRPYSIEQFLVDLCINPQIQIQFDSEVREVDQDEVAAVEERFTDPFVRSELNFRVASLVYFKDIIGALVQYKQRCEALTREQFYLTGIGAKIWETLDFGLRSKGMVLVDGLEGRGKTEAAKAWAQMHLGEARFVSLRGVVSKTAAFREIARTLGVASTYTRKASEMQARIEDLLEASGLMLVIDEAHWLFDQSPRIYKRPELVDWIVTAICNRGLPIALVTTPQFLQSMAKAFTQVAWNYKQFRRRVARRVELPEKNTAEDLKKVIRLTFPKATGAALDKIFGYVSISKRDFSAMGDVARELRYSQDPKEPNKVDLSQMRISQELVEGIIEQNLYPGDSAFARDLQGAIDQVEGIRARKRKTPPAPQPQNDEEDLVSPKNEETNDFIPPENPRFQVPETVSDAD